MAKMRPTASMAGIDYPVTMFRQIVLTAAPPFHVQNALERAEADQVRMAQYLAMVSDELKAMIEHHGKLHAALMSVAARISDRTKI